jgi:hypothetical protein
MMIGAANSEPETPWLERVKVPPETSLADSCSALAFSISSSRPAAMPFQRQGLDLAEHRNDQALLAQRRADSDVDVVEYLQPVLVPAAVDRRCDLHRLRRRRDDIGAVGELHALLRPGGLVALAMGQDALKSASNTAVTCGARVTDASMFSAILRRIRS